MTLFRVEDLQQYEAKMKAVEESDLKAVQKILNKVDLSCVDSSHKYVDPKAIVDFESAREVFKLANSAAEASKVCKFLITFLIHFLSTDFYHTLPLPLSRNILCSTDSSLSTFVCCKSRVCCTSDSLRSKAIENVRLRCSCVAYKCSVPC
jgi:hypothetical protein